MQKSSEMIMSKKNKTWEVRARVSVKTTAYKHVNKFKYNVIFNTVFLLIFYIFYLNVYCLYSLGANPI